MPASQLTPAPPAPSRAAPGTFSARADAFLSWMEATFVGQLNAMITEILGYRDTATTQATAATTQAGISTTQAVISTTKAAEAAASSASAQLAAPKWISGTAYTQGQTVWSPRDFLTYRRKVAGAGAVDHSLDTANWISVVVSFLPLQVGITYNYTGGYLSSAVYGTGNKIVYTYTGALLTKQEYYDTDGVTLLKTLTYTYTNGLVTAEAWS